MLSIRSRRAAGRPRRPAARATGDPRTQARRRLLCRRTSAAALPVLLLSSPLAWATTPPADPALERISISADGTEGNDASVGTPALSADGRFVAFTSYASNLVADDSNRVADVFVRDRLLGTVERVSTGQLGREADRGSTRPSISPDGRFVAFVSTATTLVEDDTNRQADVFLHDRDTGATTRVSVDSGEGQTDHLPSSSPSISADGRYVAFESNASDLVPYDDNRITDSGTAGDVFVRDVVRGTTERMSVTSSGAQALGTSAQPSISANGRYVAFTTTAPLVREDADATADIYVRDRRARVTRHVGQDEGGTSAGASSAPALSGDGTTVVFRSEAAPVVAGVSAVALHVHDLRQGSTRQVVHVDRPASGSPGTPSVSGDGRVVAFGWRAADGSASSEVFVHQDGATVAFRPADGLAGDPRLSSDGRLVAFSWDATHLDELDTNGSPDVFVRPVDRAVTLSASVDSTTPGGLLTVSARGFVAGERVKLSLDEAPLAWRSTDRNGVLTASIEVPHGTAAGTQLLRATARGGARVATVTLESTGSIQEEVPA